MTEHIKTMPLAWLRAALIVLALVVGVGMAARKPMPTPQFDSIEFLAYARSLFLAGVYATTPAGPQADSLPGREPLYPLAIALAAHVDPALAGALEHCFPVAADCSAGFGGLAYLNGLLLGAAGAFTVLAAGALGAGRLALVVAGLYVILNLGVAKDLKYVVSDFLAMALAALATWLLALAVRDGRRFHVWLGAGAALSALALTKSSFLPFAALLTLIAGLIGLLRLRRAGFAALTPALALTMTLGTLNGGWHYRNVAWFGASTDWRGAIALSTREVFNHMSAQEHLAAWVWWTRGMGDGLAKSMFPPEVWRRHEWYEPTGFYELGQVARHEARVARIVAANPDWPVAKVKEATTAMVAGEIIGALPSYVATMPALIYRGLWVDEFIVAGFPLLAYVTFAAFRHRRWPLLATLSLGWWTILFYPAVSLNIPRYQMTSIIALALAAGMFAQRLTEQRAANAQMRPQNS